MDSYFDLPGHFSIKPGQMFLFAGPCAIESHDINMLVAEQTKEICDRLGIQYVFKASFDKANRTSVDSYRGPGMEEGLELLRKVKDYLGLPILTDIHEAWQASHAADVVDILQIPAFLCRQTDLLKAAAETGLPVNVKKAQFLSGKDMANVVKKVQDSGCSKVMLTERGNIMGYNNLVVDFRNLADMGQCNVPVIMDATHSVQRPGGNGASSGGDSEFVSAMAKAAAVWGANGYFFEVHPDPSIALCDRETMIALGDLEDVLREVKEVYDIVQGHRS